MAGQHQLNLFAIVFSTQGFPWWTDQAQTMAAQRSEASRCALCLYCSDWRGTNKQKSGRMSVEMRNSEYQAFQPIWNLNLLLQIIISDRNRSKTNDNNKTNFFQKNELIRILKILLTGGIHISITGTISTNTNRILKSDSVVILYLPRVLLKSQSGFCGGVVEGWGGGGGTAALGNGWGRLCVIVLLQRENVTREMSEK